ncbi:TetR/AcrR family transcriptional regulator [Actinocatenispora sera]|uniref:TetR/AcrR family transcriptional regulator n=1 Tax=Actinocatenispora sera TaxID=390989 RepID=UPI0033D39A6B
MTPTTARRSPGRPRAGVHQSVYAATLRTVHEVGYARATVERIAAAAGIAKTTVYRRWPTKGALIVDCLLDAFGPMPLNTTGSGARSRAADSGTPLDASPGAPPGAAGPGTPPGAAGPGTPPGAAGPGTPPGAAGPGTPPGEAERGRLIESGIRWIAGKIGAAGVGDAFAGVFSDAVSDPALREILATRFQDPYRQALQEALGEPEHRVLFLIDTVVGTLLHRLGMTGEPMSPADVDALVAMVRGFFAATER